MYPISLERSALLSSLEFQERHIIQSAQNTYEDERTKVDGDWNKSRESIRAIMLDEIEERRKRARDEKDGDGAVIGERSLPYSPYKPFALLDDSVHGC